MRRSHDRFLSAHGARRTPHAARLTTMITVPFRSKFDRHLPHTVTVADVRFIQNSALVRRRSARGPPRGTVRHLSAAPANRTASCAHVRIDGARSWPSADQAATRRVRRPFGIVGRSFGIVGRSFGHGGNSPASQRMGLINGGRKFIASWTRSKSKVTAKMVDTINENIYRVIPKYKAKF